MLRIHDHFDGSAHCVECGGPCQLPTDEFHVSELVRTIFEAQRGMSIMMRGELEGLGVDIAAFQKRVEEKA